MQPRSGSLRTIALLILAVIVDASSVGAAEKNQRASLTSPKPASARTRVARGSKRGSNETCLPCSAQETKASKASARSASTKSRKAKEKAKEPLPCHPKDYVDPKIAKNYKAALRDMKRAGITPTITSVWRSSEEQDALHKCSLSGRCRIRKGVYSAMPSGQSLHEAGLAVDIAGIAAGKGSERHLTPQGRRIVRIMEKNGFTWRYGLADPAHFEIEPQQAGYHSVAQAIKRTRSTCQVKLIAAQKSHKSNAKTASARVKAQRPSKKPAPTTVAGRSGKSSIASRQTVSTLTSVGVGARTKRKASI